MASGLVSLLRSAIPYNVVYPNFARKISLQFSDIAEYGSNMHPSGRTSPSSTPKSLQ
nr:hypothetical protein GZ9D8_2 [uncultured archaeon GZfos9D8]